MTRFPRPLLLAALLLLAPPSAIFADEGGDAEEQISLHDVRDLTRAHPWLADVLRSSFPEARIETPRDGVLVVTARDRTDRALGRVLAWLREYADRYEDLKSALRFRARLARRRVSGTVEDGNLWTFLSLLREQQGINVMISTELKNRVEGMTVSMHVEDEPYDVFLDRLAKLAPMRWVVENSGTVRFVPLEPNFVTQRSAITVEHQEGTSAITDDPDVELREALRALREEVRALRAEIREIKELLETRRER